MVSLDRFLAIKSPLSSRRRVCAHRKYAIVPLIFAFSASFTSYNLFAIKVVRSNETVGTGKFHRLTQDPYRQEACRVGWIRWPPSNHTS